MSSGRRTAAALLLILLLLPAGAAFAGPTPCFDVGVQYLGRTFYGNIGGIDYYTWNYRVTGESCINRGVSHWVLGVCQNYWNLITNISTQSIDNSQSSGGLVTNYSPKIGPDPTTGVSGLKWDYISGNQINVAGEFDDFSFVAPGSETVITVSWASKGATILDYGTTVGPSCTPVAVESKSWGGIKARF